MLEFKYFYTKKFHKKFYSVDLICHGPTDPKVAAEYIGKLEKKYGSELIHINVRAKNPYSRPAYLYAGFRNGREHKEPFYETAYGIAFFNMALPGCYDCKHKGPNHYSDLTIGDYWGSKEGDPGYNPYGASVAFVYTEKGEKLLKNQENFTLFPADCRKALKANPRYLTSSPSTPAARAFRENFNKKGLFYAVRKSQSFPAQLKKRIKKLLKSFSKG
ncbi:MAG: Coenzyme F420 hydrogenase/dehydrogenase, beta subunit C-terminal domain [Oscillospiraceae bacterium]|nr:Coenzyme F420 hydrogenase/dehydrogenase, beta subunit C-terminal domain [Oscillospiraceae bacterium]